MSLDVLTGFDPKMTKLIEIMKIGDDAHLILEESDVRRIVLGGIFWPEIMTKYKISIIKLMLRDHRTEHA